ncbi:MAG: non-heme iron oxygenase ferredoxin subunit [Gemmatirosa sp.]|nr:non-heme iron oxygenase ferredoxin subunit [Gemmatirosa sp.]
MTATDSGYVRAASLDALAPDSMLGVIVSGERVCLVRLGDDVYALEDRCTHALFPLSRGTLLPNGTVECPWHGAQFDCRTGAPCRGPATLEAQTYDVLLRDGDVHVKLRR